MTIFYKGRADFLRLGDWNATCYFCGRKRKASDMRKQWQGFYVCIEEWEPRPAQDFVRGVPDKMAAPWQQAPSTDKIVTVCDYGTSSAIPSYAGPGCMTPSRNVPPNYS